MARMRAKYGKDDKGQRYLKYYYGEFYDAHRHPQQKRISLRTRDRDAARLALADMERRFLAGLFDPWEDKPQREGVTVREAVALFLKNREARCVPNTVATYRAILEPFADTMPPGLLLYAVEQRYVAVFLDEGKRSDATRRSYTDQLRIFFAWCRDEGLMKSDPMPPAVRGKRRRLKKLPQFLSEEEYESLIRAIEADGMLKKEMPDDGRGLIDIIRFAVGTGLRRGEVCNLQWSAIDLSGGMLTVKNTEDFQTKSGRERPVPLVGEAREVIERREAERTTEADGYVFKGAKGGKLNGNYLGKRFRQYRRLARLPESINVHSLRHTFASWAVQRGMDLYRLKEIMGHADMKTTLVYAHLRPEALKHEMERCFGDVYLAERSEVERLRALLTEKKTECDELRREIALLKEVEIAA